METILKHIVREGQKILKYGQVDEKIILELKMTPSLYPYIEIVTNYYDDESLPFFNNWTDVEGMGYGWIWNRYEEKDWHRMMTLETLETANALLKVAAETLYFVYEGENEKTFHFVTLGEGNWRQDELICFSKVELF